MPFKERKYKPNQSIIKVFGDGDNRKIKVVTMKSLRTSGLECDDFTSSRELTKINYQII